MGRHLRDFLPAVRDFYQLKEFLMERKEWKTFITKLISTMKNSFIKGSCNLPKLTVGDRVRIQNQTNLRKIRWDRTNVITGILRDRQYTVLIDGSCRITVRNLRQVYVPKPEVVLEEEDEEEGNKGRESPEFPEAPETPMFPVPTNGSSQQFQPEATETPMVPGPTNGSSQQFQPEVPALALEAPAPEAPGHRVHQQDWRGGGMASLMPQWSR